MANQPNSGNAHKLYFMQKRFYVKVIRLRTHHDLEVVTRDDCLSVLHPAHGGLRVSRHGTLHLNVRALVGVRVGWVVQELGWH